ncbi:MAG: TonB-dependent receptor, partial [Verrucomicrobia bacterium]|nr:TonB-dependent receptor [Verrucomicrobiota bacterium]
SPPAPDHIRHLDRFVVSAGHDPKTLFDLAQGTSVLAGEELHRVVQGTLGETLAGTPGVSSTYHGPGASRPVIRGLGGDRVRVLDNGVGALDASGLSPDHNTTLEPLFASRLEVLRGPSTLLYGSSAVGGVVNVIDNAIPDAAAANPAAGAFELRAGGAARERTAVVSAGGGRPRLAARVNALYRRSGDLRIPGVPRRDHDAPAVQPPGILPGSSSETFSGSLGAGVSWAAGKAGAALHHYDTEYGVPAGDGIFIQMRQTRLALEGEATRPFGIFRGATARLGLGAYTHSELGADNTVHTTFDNDAWEARLELPHAALGGMTGTLGLQAARSDLTARGDEVVTPPARTHSSAVFALEEWPLGARATLQLGARLEAQRLAVGAVDPTLPPVSGYAARTGQRKKFTGASASLGLVVYPAKDWSLGLAAAGSERLPAAAELFAHGPHGGTAAYEVGSTGLGPERSLGLDVSLRRRAGFITGSLGGFVHRFRDFIYLQELPAGAIPAARNPEEFTPHQFVATDARFTGAEAELLVHLIETEHRRLHFELSADLVRATQTPT